MAAPLRRDREGDNRPGRCAGPLVSCGGGLFGSGWGGAVGSPGRHGAATGRACSGELRWPERTEEGAGEHRWEVGIPFPGSVGAEGGRRWGLHGDVVLGGGNGGGGRRVAFLGKGKEERL